MELKLSVLTGSSSPSVIQVTDEVFAKEFNPGLIHQVVCAYQAGMRAGTRAQKTRAEVSGGGAKPWRQKGTGRARAGTNRSPIWRSGGVAFAAKPRDYSQKVNRKMYRGAICSILSELVRQDRMVIVDEFTVNSKKTRELVKKLNELNLNNNVLVVVDIIEPDLYLAARNLNIIAVCDVEEVNPVSLVGFEKVLFTVPALKKIEERLA